jgi:hypothetical protein
MSIEIEKILQLQSHALADTKPSTTPPAIYLFAESDDLKRSVQDLGVWANTSLGVKILLSGGKGNCYSGFDIWKEDMLKRGIRNEDIIPVPAAEDLNSYTEAVSLVDFLNSRGWESVYVTAPPFHLPRAFLTVISVIVKTKSKIKVYATSTTPLNWQNPVTHYQGVVVDTPLNFVVAEIERVGKYQTKGDLISFDQAFLYLKNRESLI